MASPTKSAALVAETPGLVFWAEAKGFLGLLPTDASPDLPAVRGQDGSQAQPNRLSSETLHPERRHAAVGSLGPQAALAAACARLGSTAEPLKPESGEGNSLSL